MKNFYESKIMLNENELIQILQKASDCYYNTGDYYELAEDEYDGIIDTLQIPCQICITDSIYDEIYNRTKKLYPNNHFFKEVGIKERSLEKVKLPCVMGSMTELHKGELLDWINPLWQYCCSAKLDGCSCGLIYKNGKLWKAYTRGDGYEGQDITTTVMRFGTYLPKEIDYTDGDLLVRGEIIIPKEEISTMIEELKNETGRTYKNGRNSVAGCLNSKIAPQSFVNHAHLVCYHIEGDFVRESSIFELLEKLGFEIPLWGIIDGENIEEENMIQYNIKLKNDYIYEIDGTILTENLRITKGFDTGTINPKMSKKFKVGCINDYKESKVVNIHWQISKDGYAKPVVEIEPIELDGAEVSFVTGNNFDNIVDNKISIGSIVKCHRAGQVIPFIDEVIKSDEREEYNLPSLEYFDHVGTDLVLTKHLNYDNISNEMLNEFFSLQDEMQLQRAVYFCQKMSIDFAGEGNLKKLFSDNKPSNSYTSNPSVYLLLQFSKEFMVNKIGINGGKLYDSLHEKLQNMNMSQFFDALGVFGRGIGEKKLQKLIDKYDSLDLSYDEVLNVEGFAETTASQYTNHINDYKEWYDIINSNMNEYSFKSNEKNVLSNELKDLTVIFTGIRDKDMESRIISKGGRIASSFTKDVNLVITKDINSNSSKIQKAKQNGIAVISYDAAKKQY